MKGKNQKRSQKRRQKRRRRQEKSQRRRQGIAAVRQRQDKAIRARFLEGLDSYEKEYRKLLRQPLVKGLLGVYELEDDEFYNLSADERLQRVGLHGCSAVYYDVEYDNQPTSAGKQLAAATACTSVVRDAKGRLRPAILMRKSFRSDASGDEGEESRLQTRYAVKLLVLLHEQGHAQDIMLGTNYDHRAQKLDIIGAELFAHSFVCTQAKKRNYRLALGIYLGDLEQKLGSEAEYQRIVAKRFFEENDAAVLKAFADYFWLDNPQSAEYRMAMRRVLEREMPPL